MRFVADQHVDGIGLNLYVTVEAFELDSSPLPDDLTKGFGECFRSSCIMCVVSVARHIQLDCDSRHPCRKNDFAPMSADYGRPSQANNTPSRAIGIM